MSDGSPATSTDARGVPPVAYAQPVDGVRRDAFWPVAAEVGHAGG
ncbi:MAG: hypothetical protein AAF563_13635 [Pseudomonadota bacterium]